MRFSMLLTPGVPLRALATLLLATASASSALAQGTLSAPSDSGALTLADVIARAVRNNPAAVAAEAQAEAAQASYASARGAYLPTLALTPTLVQSQSTSPQSGGLLPQRNSFAANATVNYLLLDFGGRSGSVGAARQAERAAGFTSGAVAQNVVLQAEAAYFAYNTARDLLRADSANVATATADLHAAQQRFHVGLATVADTLQASTALAQARLGLLSSEGNLQTARGNLAAAMGTSADTPFEIARESAVPPMESVETSVDSVIALAVRSRPDLAAAQAQAASAAERIRVARSNALPALAFTGTGGRTLAGTVVPNGMTYSLNFGLQIPIFSGGARQADIHAAEALANAARAQAEATRVQVTNQVFTSYHNLRTATARVRTSAELLASAVQQEEVARGRYNEGVGTFLDVLTAQTALANARAQDALARWGWYTSLAQLSHDAGVLGNDGTPHLRMTSDTTSKVLP